jgi:hypothetical protein
MNELSIRHDELWDQVNAPVPVGSQVLWTGPWRNCSTAARGDLAIITRGEARGERPSVWN